MKLVFPTFHVNCAEYNEALADPEGLSWQVLVLLNSLHLMRLNLVCYCKYLDV